ncbi:MAG: hypothetical protein KGZ88_21635 [Methylomicrobium sp.]|nr:hypothetical protein [Methylomicrobium sp.]
MKDIAFSSLARVFVVVFQLINIKLYTNYLDAEELGIYFFLLTASYSANALLFIPVDYFQQSILVKVKSATGGARAILNFNGRLAALYGGFSLLIVAICAIVTPHFAYYALLATLLAFAIYAVQALRSTLNNLEHRSCVTVSFIQEAFIKVLLFFALVQFFKADLALLVLSWLIALLVSGTYLMFKAKAYQIFAGSDTYPIHAKEVYTFSYPFSIGAVCNWLQLQGYRLILVPMGFAEEVGVFATLSSIGSAAIGAVSLIYSQQFIPLIYKTAGQYTAKYLKGAMLVIFGVAVACLVLGEFMVTVLTNPNFVQHWELLMYGVITDSAYLIGGAMVIHLTLLGNTKRLIQYAWVGLASMTLCFGLLYWTDTVSIGTFGVPLLVSQWLGLLYMYTDYKKLVPKSIS